MHLNNNIKLIIGLLVPMMAITQCKQRQASGLSSVADGSHVVTNVVGDIGSFGGARTDLDFQKTSEVFIEYNMKTTGIAIADIYLCGTDLHLASPIRLAVFAEDDLSKPIASGQKGPFKMKGDNCDISTFSINVSKAQKYYLLIQHENKIQASLDPSVSPPNYRVDTLLEDASGVQKNRAGFYPEQISVNTFNQNPIEFSFESNDPKSNELVNFRMSYTATESSAELTGYRDNCPKCSAKLEVNYPDGTNLILNISKLSSNYQDFYYLLNPMAGEYKFKFIPAGFQTSNPLQRLSVEFRKVSVKPTKALGLIPIDIGKDVSAEGLADGKAVGGKLSLIKDTDIKIDLRFGYLPILGVGAVLAEDSRTISSKRDVLIRDSLGKIVSTHDWTKAIVVTLPKGDYTVEYVGYNSVSNEGIVYVEGKLTSEGLRIPNGGPNISTFSDNSTKVTSTPPAGYLVDRVVPANSVFFEPVPAGTKRFTPASPETDLASLSVLNAMEAIRQDFHQKIPEGIQRNPSHVQRNFQIDSDYPEMCLGNEAAHWSDITIHYYCQFGAQRGCYTGGVRDRVQFLGSKLGSPPDPEIVKQFQMVRANAFKQCSKSGFKKTGWNWINKNQADVFRYLMESRTFAFKMDQQQAVINKYYRINNPADPKECLEKRPRRAIDPDDGTHCLPNKIFKKPLQAAGR